MEKKVLQVNCDRDRKETAELTNQTNELLNWKFYKSRFVSRTCSMARVISSEESFTRKGIDTSFRIARAFLLNNETSPPRANTRRGLSSHFTGSLRAHRNARDVARILRDVSDAVDDTELDTTA